MNITDILHKLRIFDRWLNLYQYAEVDSQEYRGNNCIMSAGVVFGHKYDTIYLKLEKEGKRPTIFYFRKDEAARVAGLLANAVWSKLIQEIQIVEEKDGDSQ